MVYYILGAWIVSVMISVKPLRNILWLAMARGEILLNGKGSQMKFVFSLWM